LTEWQQVRSTHDDREGREDHGETTRNSFVVDVIVVVVAMGVAVFKRQHTCFLV
jgi:hypothetical protein